MSHVRYERITLYVYVLLQLLAAPLYSEIYQFLSRDIVVRFSIPDFVL